MKQINLIAIIALISLCLFSCDIDQPRPNTGKVTVVLEDIPNGVGAVSIWCAANEWKADNVNGSSQYIVNVDYTAGDDKGTASFVLTDYVLSTPLQFQFTPMPSA